VDIANEDQEDRYEQRCEKTHNFLRAVCGDNFGVAQHGRLQTNKDFNGSKSTTPNANRS